ncbi:MAG: PorP/SprF family type IX secretion system membrane protein [Saprospiraceae bacterium]
MKIRQIFLCIFLLRICFATAQDPHISQFFANRLYLNPAFAGIDDGLLVNATARNQWYAANKGYSFYTLSAEWQEPCWRSGFGLMLTHAREGLAPLVSSSGALTYRYGDYEKGFNVALQCSFNQKYLDWSRFTFSDELDPVFGDIYGSAVADGEATATFLGIAAGLLYRWDSRVKTRGGMKFQTRWHLGLAAHHLASLFGEGPDASFLPYDTEEVPPRLTLHGGVIIPLTFLKGVNNSLLISPNFRLESQGPEPYNLGKSQTLFSGGIYVVFMNKLTVGALYHNRSIAAGTRHTSAMTYAIGLSSLPTTAKSDAFYIGLSIDVNPTGLGWESKNTYEFNFRYTFRGGKTFCTPTGGQRFGGGGSTGCPLW